MKFVYQLIGETAERYIRNMESRSGKEASCIVFWWSLRDTQVKERGKVRPLSWQVLTQSKSKRLYISNQQTNACSKLESSVHVQCWVMDRYGTGKYKNQWDKNFEPKAMSFLGGNSCFSLIFVFASSQTAPLYTTYFDVLKMLLSWKRK